MELSQRGHVRLFISFLPMSLSHKHVVLGIVATDDTVVTLQVGFRRGFVCCSVLEGAIFLQLQRALAQPQGAFPLRHSFSRLWVVATRDASP